MKNQIKKGKNKKQGLAATVIFGICVYFFSGVMIEFIISLTTGMIIELIIQLLEKFLVGDRGGGQQEVTLFEYMPSKGLLTIHLGLSPEDPRHFEQALRVIESIFNSPYMKHGRKIGLKINIIKN
jgi:hypothetical protein